ncbi:MAG TPA: DUF3313 family protein [Xanthomonadales bacterium]|nr:DUF3313 family protein [Xanthomonadales bacterium]
MSLKPETSTHLIKGLLGLICLVASAVLVADEPPEVTEEGLERVPGSEWGLVYVLPGADFSGYDAVHLMEPEIAFRDNYRRDMNRGSGSMRITQSDMDRIRRSLATQFDEVFTSVFEEDDSWSVTDTPGENVLTLQPSIVNLDPTAPDVNNAARNRTYAESAGEMTLYLEIHDSTTGALIAKGLDRKEDRRRGYMQWQSRASNKAAADKAIRSWATSLRDGLNAARDAGKAE